jgi:hypothetical protein
MSSPSSSSHPPAPPESPDNRRLRRRHYAEIVETADEFEGLIGVVEDFLDEEGNSQRMHGPETRCVVLHVPTHPDTQANLRLRDVNELTSYVRAQLRREDDRLCFPSAQLAWFDPDWL